MLAQLARGLQLIAGRLTLGSGRVVVWGELRSPGRINSALHGSIGYRWLLVERKGVINGGDEN